MSPANAAKMQDLITQYGGNVRMVLSPRQNDYAAPRLMDYSGLFKYDIDLDGVIAPGLQPVYDAEGNPVDLDGDGKDDYRESTDYTFTDVERDQFGRPISQVDNVGLGNSKIPAATAEGETPTNPNPDEATTDGSSSGSSTGSGTTGNGSTGNSGNGGSTESTDSSTEAPVDETSGADSNG